MIKVIAYDIPDDKIRNRIARYLEKNGSRIQKSVFIVDKEPYLVKKILRVLYKINKKNGIIHVFGLCKGCCKKAVFIGEEKQKFFFF